MNRKYAKKCWTHIRRISNAGCMNEVMQVLNDSVMDFFKVRHLGLMKVRMVKDGRVDEFEAIKEARFSRMEAGKYDLRKYIASFIPVRMHTSIMYKNLVL